MQIEIHIKDGDKPDAPAIRDALLEACRGHDTDILFDYQNEKGQSCRWVFQSKDGPIQDKLLHRK